MGKYSDIVKSKNQSQLPENQKSRNNENDKSGLQENQKSINNENNKSGKQQSDKTSEPEIQKSIPEDMVNLSIKVPRKLRQKWVAESRLRGTTLTAIITDYLKSELGE